MRPAGLSRVFSRARARMRGPSKYSNSHFANVGRASGPPVGGASRSAEGPEAPRTGRPEACPTFDAQNENCCVGGTAMRQEDTANSIHSLKERVTTLEKELAELKRRGPGE